MWGPSVSTKVVMRDANSPNVEVMVLSSVCVDIDVTLSGGAIGLVNEYCNSP